ncbi:MAG: 50S ribosomal protein L11 methyltransferase [Gammaproteobacteria bacterium]
MKCVSIELFPENTEFVEALMFEFGATAVTFEDAEDVPLLEPKPGEMPLWPNNVVTGWFEDEADLTQLQNSIAMNFPKVDFKIGTVESQDWQKNLHDQFKPIFFGETLCICPSWETKPNGNHAILELDPGLAFGTGSHPTTSMCLEWLATHLKPGQTLLDYGCGSGILALSAIKLGASKVWAVDYDPQALQSTQSNAIRNQISAKTLITLGIDALHLIPKVDIIVANILAQPLIELASQFREYTHPESILVLSGILAEQASDVEAAYSDWVTFIERHQTSEWVCLIGRTKA